MSKRQRWRPVRGTGSRVYEARERLLLGALDLPLRAAFGAARGLGLAPPPEAPRLDELRDVLVFRLDRIGDVLMCLPALAALRAALPAARLRLVVGAWARTLAAHAPVDEVLVWSAPWVGRASEGAEPVTTLMHRAHDLSRAAPDLALDLQGDVRANLLLWLTGARHRVGYANTGGGSLLTEILPLDETLSWPEQNRRAVATALGRDATEDPGSPVWPASLRDAGRPQADRLLADLGLEGSGPLVGIHPSGGRAIKQWPIARWTEVGRRLHREHGATILVTGSAADRPLAAELARALPESARDVSGRLDIDGTLALLARLDLFLSPDTGPMHMACAVGAPSVAIFGPSDPVRYFSGGDPAAAGARHLVVAPDLWCAPCNLIRRPPAECADAELPECLSLVSAEAVYAAAARLLEASGR